MALGYITQHKDYWIAPNAITITLNALGEANRIQGSVASGAVIMCWIDGITELGYDNGHEYRRWPLSLSPTYFNTDTEKYVYAAVPRSATIGSQAVIVFPSEQLDINGKNASEQQIGSTDYLYIYLHGIISEVLTENGSTIRKWTLDPRENWGQLDTAAARDAQKNTTDWYHYDQSTQLVTLLKGIVMSATSWFQNLRLGNKNLTGVATAATGDAYADSDEMVATPGFVKSRYLSKTTDDQAQGNIEFLKDVTVRGNMQTDGDMAVGGDTNISGLLQVVKDVIAKAVRSWNYTGDGVADTGFNLTDNDGTGHSKLIVDNLLVRMKATFIEMEIKELSAVAGDFVFSQASGRIEEVHYLDADGHTIGVDKVNVPWLVRMLPMAVQRRWMLGRRQQVQRQWDKLTESERNSVKNFRCFIRSDDGTTRLINTWRTGDLARCQTLDIESTTRDDGTRIAGRGQGDGADSIDRHQTQGNVFYWRRVNLAAVTTTGTRQRCYVDLGNNTEGDDYYNGSDVPCAGDIIVCFGNDTDITRQGLVIIETTGTDAPAIKEYRGIGNPNNTGGKWSLNGLLKTKISPATGNRFVAPSFVIETDDGEQDVGESLSRLEVSQGLIKTEVAEVQKAVVSPNLLDNNKWKNNDTGAIILPDTNGRVFFPSGVDLDSESLSLKAGTYVFSFYALKDEEHPMGLMPIALLNGDDEIALQVKVVQDTEECRYYGWFYLATDQSIHILVSYEDSIGIEYIKHAQLETGNNPSRYVDTKGLINTASFVEQTAEEINLSVQNGLERTGINIKDKKITLSAKTTEATNDFFAKSLRTLDTGAGSISLQNGLMEIINPMSEKANIKIGFNGTYMVLQFFDNEGHYLYDLGPNGLSILASQDRKFAADTTYMFLYYEDGDVWMKSDNDTETALADLWSFVDFIFSTTANDRNALQSPYKYEAKINAGVYQADTQSNPSLTAEEARSFNQKYFYESSSSPKSQGQELLTGILVKKTDVGEANYLPNQFGASVVDGVAVPPDYNEALQAGEDVDFSVYTGGSYEGMYKNGIKRRYVFLVEDGIFVENGVVYKNVE